MSTPLPPSLSLPSALARLPRRLRIALTTKPLAYWLATAVVAGLTGLAVHAVASDAAEVRRRYGVLRPALVATRSLVPGEVLDRANTARRELPAALVSDGVLAELPAGALVAAPIAAGEAIHAVRVGRAGDGPVAALLADGARGIAIPTGDRGDGLPLRVGDRVDVIAAIAVGGGGGARVVAAGAAVVHVGDRTVVVGVPAGEAPAVAQALADGGVVLALSAGP